jgi:hypothetical protein
MGITVYFLKIKEATGTKWILLISLRQCPTEHRHTCF